VDLPSNFTTINMYKRYCYEIGWAIKADNNERYHYVADYAKRNTNGILWQDSMKMTEVVWG
jgi:hypothetical protein